MTRYNAGGEQEIYELFLSKLKNNTNKLGIIWVLQTKNAHIRTEDGRY